MNRGFRSLRPAWALPMLVVALSGCVGWRNPTTMPPDETFYYRGNAKSVASCVLTSALTAEACAGFHPLLLKAEGGATAVVRCAAIGADGSGAAGAGLAGFAAGQIFERAMAGYNSDLDGDALIVGAFRDVALETVEARLWIAPVVTNGETRRANLLKAVDECGGSKLAGRPPSTFPSGKLIP